jgi:hypothetical protein
MAFVATLTRKARTFLKNPRHATLAKFAHYRVRRARAYIEENGLSPLLASSGAEMKPQFYDLAFLHRTIRKHQPYTVLEFGSGFSTLFIADALQRNDRGKVVSVDSNGSGWNTLQLRVIGSRSAFFSRATRGCFGSSGRCTYQPAGGCRSGSACGYAGVPKIIETRQKNASESTARNDRIEGLKGFLFVRDANALTEAKRASVVRQRLLFF